MAFKLRNFTDDEAIRRVWDVEDIKNLISRYSYYEASNKRAECIDELWVSEPANQASASFGRNWGFFVGLDAIKKYYVDGNRFGAKGTSNMHPFSTKLLCIAEDGKTAQGLWMGIAYESAPNGEGVLEGKWINERMAIDFIKEGDSWKIWHVFVGTNFTNVAGADYCELELNTELREYRNGNPSWYMVGKGRTEMVGEVAKFDQIIDYPEREVFLVAGPTYVADVYTALYNDQISFPQLPVDYRSFEDTTPYTYEGFVASVSTGEGRTI